MIWNFWGGICQGIRTMDVNVMCKILAANLKQWQKKVFIGHFWVLVKLIL